MKRTLLIAVSLMVCASLLISCAPAAAPAAEEAAPAAEEAAPAAEEAAPAAEETHTLVFIPGSLSNPSQAFGWKMFQKHAAEYNFDVSVLDGKADVQEQTKAINNAVAQGVDVIMVNPNDALAVVPALKEARAAGVIVGMFMVTGDEDSSDFFVSVDDTQAGAVVVQGILELFPDGATGVEIGGQAGHDAAIKRHDGFETARAEYPSIEVLDYKNPQAWDAAQAQTIAEDMITKYGDQIQYIFCHWDNGATGVLNALTAADMTDVLVIGVDGNSVAFDQVKSWKNYISIMQNAETITIKSMEMANLFLANDPAAIHDVYVPFDLVTKETIDNFTPPEW